MAGRTASRSGGKRPCQSSRVFAGTPIRTCRCQIRDGSTGSRRKIYGRSHRYACGPGPLCHGYRRTKLSGTCNLSSRPDNDGAGQRYRDGQRRTTGAFGVRWTYPAVPVCCSWITHAEDRIASGRAWHGHCQPAPCRRATFDRTEAGKPGGSPPAFIRHRYPGQVAARPWFQRGQGHGTTTFSGSKRYAAYGCPHDGKPGRT